MVGAVDCNATPVAIYREWLGSLPAAAFVLIRDGSTGERRYVARAWLDEIATTSPQARPWLDEIAPTTPTTTRPWLDEIAPTSPQARPWLDEYDPVTPAVRPWLDEIAPGTPAVRNWLDEYEPIRPALRSWLDEIDRGSPVAQPPGVVTRGGANEVAFSRPQGRVRIWLPDDMAAGDTISGTVTAEPSGRDQNERQANSDTLEGSVIEIDGKPARVAGGRFRFVVPAGLTSVGIALVQENRRVADARLNLPATPERRPEGVNLPELGQAGRPLEIPGNFDGNAANTTVSIGGQPGEVIAEGPRQATVWAPQAPVDETRIAVTENGRTTEGPYRNVRFDLSAPRTTLQRGDQVAVHILVQGLAGITAPVTVRLEASQSVQMAGGNSQTITIAPSAVGPGGVYQTDRTLQAREAGAFTVSATLVAP